MSAFTFVDLFAGIGGMRSGLEGAGGECLFSCEIDRFARQTYEANFSPVDWYDMNTLNVSIVPEHDVLAGGFPCQPFSLAGVSKKRHLGQLVGMKDPRQGQLFFQLMRIVRERAPRVVLLENVLNLRRIANGRALAVIESHLRRAGYEVSVGAVSARSWVPQNRRRLFIVAVRDGPEFLFPPMPDPGELPKLRDILEPRPGDRYTITDRLWEYLPRYAAKHRERGNGFGYSLADPNGATRTLSARYHKDGAEILIPQDGKNPRRLTPRECARLMGFPDRFEIPVSNSQAYRQFGNSVVVPVVEHVAKAIIEQCLSDSALGRASMVPGAPDELVPGSRPGLRVETHSGSVPSAAGRDDAAEDPSQSGGADLAEARHEVSAAG